MPSNDDAADEALVGKPVGHYTAADEPSPGPFFAEADYNRLDEAGEFSDHLCNCFSDLEICICGAFLPCLVNWRSMRRLGGEVPLALGLPLTAGWYVAIFLTLWLADVVSPPLVAFHAGADAGWMTASIAIVSTVFEICVFFAFRDRLRVYAEQPLVTLLKTMCCWSCYTCQVARHVNRKLGYWNGHEVAGFTVDAVRSRVHR